VIPLEFTTTATIRPEIVRRTYASFKAHLKGVDWAKSTAYVNVDPLPEGKCALDVVEAIRESVGNVTHRHPSKANYSLAYKLVWSQPTGDFFFNLEDDWELCEDVDVETLLAPFADDKIVAVPLRAYSYWYKSTPTSPSMYRTSYFKDIAERMHGNENPETQLHDLMNVEYENYKVSFPESGKERHPGNRTSVYPSNERHIIVKDIGREWSEQSGYTRPQVLDKSDPRYVKKNHFTSWVKK